MANCAAVLPSAVAPPTAASASGKPSYVLRALGRSAAEAAASLRFGLGCSTTVADIDQTLAAVQEALLVAAYR